MQIVAVALMLLGSQSEARAPVAERTIARLELKIAQLRVKAEAMPTAQSKSALLARAESVTKRIVQLKQKTASTEPAPAATKLPMSSAPKTSAAFPES